MAPKDKEGDNAAEVQDIKAGDPLFHEPPRNADCRCHITDGQVNVCEACMSHDLESGVMCLLFYQGVLAMVPAPEKQVYGNAAADAAAAKHFMDQVVECTRDMPGAYSKLSEFVQGKWILADGHAVRMTAEMWTAALLAHAEGVIGRPPHELGNRS